MKNILRFVFLSFFVARAAMTGSLPDWPKARITVKVLGEDGSPISDATVHIGFLQGGNAWVGERQEQAFHGPSDSNGYFSAEALSETSVGGCVEKDGYYPSYWEYTFDGNSRNSDQWKPWNPTNTVVLRKIGNPIPMYAKRIAMRIPRSCELYGFDLIAADWVRPAGKGEVSDLVFRVDGYWSNRFDNAATMTLTFINPADGILPIATNEFRGSVFASLREAPEQGYEPRRIWRKIRKDTPNHTADINVSDYDAQMNYVFRIRTVTDEHGSIVNARYGKVYGDIKFGGASTEGSLLEFTYYLNPTPNDRNLEFDPSRNLFEDLKSSEEVTDP